MREATFWHRLDGALARLRPWRAPLSLTVDALVVALCWNLTYLFRIGFERWFEVRPSYDVWVMLGTVAVYLVAFVAMRVPQGLWRFSGFGEVRRLTIACFAAGLVSAVVVLMLQLTKVPRAVLALHPVVTLMGVCIARLGYRMLYEHSRERITGGSVDVRRAIVMGAGEAARLLLAGIHRQGWTVLGLLDDDASKQGSRIADAPVLGTLEDVRRVEVRGTATHVIVALPGATAARRKRALDLAAASGLPVLMVPTVRELEEGRSALDRLREVEPEDLLGREPVQLDEAGIAESLEGKTVLVTGAGGSIGSELCRQIARHAPARLVLAELSEFNLYSIEQALGEEFPHLPVARLITDVKDLPHLRSIFAAWRPEVVFHAAAYKHVPLMETGNAWAALRNNTLGTYHAALAAAESGTERFVLISTDKAVNPTSVMGATKRAAEMLVSDLAFEHPGTRFMAVRFGNVLGSSGSVIPKFKEQIGNGGPVTVTHPDVIRYFMTVKEAVRLVLQAAAIGETGQVYVLDMGEPVRIVDLARQMIRLAGAGDDVQIVFSGLRPGEKLYEELLVNAEITRATRVERLHISAPLASGGRARGGLELCTRIAATAAANDFEARRQLRTFVPDYRTTSSEES